VDCLLSEFRDDPSCFLLKLDCGFSVLGPLEEEFPDRIRNTGCREQATVSVAAGMASEGMRPFIYSIASFLIFRALEQIRLDLVENNLKVKLIGYGAGNARFATLGISHTTGTADIDVCDAIGLPVFPGFAVKGWMAHDGPAYLRLQ
jgi:transketolase